MKLDTKQILKNLNGEAFKDGDKDLTLSSFLIMVLFTLDEQKKLQGSEKIERNKIATKLYDADPIAELNLSQVGKIKNLLDAENMFHVRVVAEAIRMLEEATEIKPVVIEEVK